MEILNLLNTVELLNGLVWSRSIWKIDKENRVRDNDGSETLMSGLEH